MALPRLTVLQGGRDARPDPETPLETRAPEIIYRADYTHWWRLPPPMPPRRPPWALLAVLAGVLLGALVLAMGD